MNQKHKISLSFFKQTFILFSVSLFLLLLTTIFHFGVIGVIVFIRASFMLYSQYKEYKKYEVIENEKGFFIKRNNEEIYINHDNIYEQSFKEKRFSKTLYLKVKAEGDSFQSLFVIDNLKK